jgi:hypothetical protein
MDKKYIEENEIEIKYLRNQLSDTELERFEEYLMENPKALEQVSLDAMLQENLGKVKHRELNSETSIGWFRSLLRNRVVTSATAFGIGALVVSLFQFEERDRSGLETAEIIYLFQTRGLVGSGDQLVKVDLSAGGSGQIEEGRFVMVLDLPKTIVGSVDVVVESIDKSLASRQFIKRAIPSELGTITLLLKKSNYSRGIYEIKIYDTSDTTQPLVVHRFEAIEY